MKKHIECVVLRWVGVLMSFSCVFMRSRSAMMIAAAGFAAALMSGCSSDVTRFSDPYANPFNASNTDRMATGSVVAAAPVQQVQARPLPPAGTIYRQPAAPRVSSIAPGTVVGNANGWSATGGTPIVLADGETLMLISRRYGVPPVALLRANGFASADEVRPGTRLIIPVYRPGAAVAEQDRPVRSTRRRVDVAEDDPAPVVRRKPRHVEEDADAEPPKKRERKEAHKLAERDDAVVVKHKKHTDDTADDEPVKKSHPKKKIADEDVKKKKKNVVSEDDTPIVKDRKKVAALPAAPKVAVEVPKKPAKMQTAKLEKAVVTDPMPTSSLPPAEPSKPEFRWPARGRIIQGFRPGGNDGINIAVPEGTSVKAAESGTVAYAGSELKGYGNMVLIRHSNGYVTAYANNGELDVKRGDTVKRGQIIAKSGQTGNANGPQLHFELRKGSTPIDPTNYLAGL
jgi:murein DD-endopeptidase MepM/ murein hydrolase activator NlpD